LPRRELGDLPNDETNKTVPDTRLLQIDKDIVVSRSWLREYREVVRLVLRLYGLKPTVIRITPSRRKGSHVRIYLDKSVPAEEANILHWLLGDDASRVDFNRARIEAEFAEWCKLFERARDG